VFNLAAFAASEEMILAEAPLDALTFWCAGYRNVTCAWGAGGLTEEIIAALSEHKIKRVLIAYDRDSAGDKGAASVAEKLAPLGIGVYRVNFPKGMDANAYALAVTPAAKSLGALLRAAEWMRVHDVDYPRSALIVRKGKGNKDRVVPLGERAKVWMAAYRDQVRPGLVAGCDPHHLFLSRQGNALDPKRLSEKVRG
jgi:DNA primase